MKHLTYIKRCSLRRLTNVTALAIMFTLLFAGNSFAADDDGLSFNDKRMVETQLLRQIRSSFVDTSVTMNDVIDGAIEGLMGKLDPHSSYLPVKRANDFEERIRGNFEGVGISFAMIDGKITVIEVIPGGPSEAAGLKSRDKIIRVNDESAVGVDNDQVKDLLRGPKGSEVNVYVERPGHEDLVPFTITRGRVEVNSVSQAFMINPGTGYIKVTKFAINTDYDFKNALVKLRDQGLERLVLDLRGNSGGSLDAAVNMVDNFLLKKRQLIVETKGRNTKQNLKQVSSGEGEFPDLPLIIMINHGSASASEVVSGALQDHDRALIVGQTSFGKGLVMNQWPLRFQGKPLGTLLLSTAHYYTPSGRLIQRPYEEGRDEYLRAGYDNIDMNAADSTKTDQPVFYTDLGRTVYGGGGITPDYTLSSLRRLNSLERQHRSSNIFFEFADGYLLRHDDLPEDFYEFRDNYTIPSMEIEAFRTFMTEKGIKTEREKEFRDELDKLVKKFEIDEDKAKQLKSLLEKRDVDLDEKIFSESIDFITREIKGEIARMVWGSEERYRMWQTDDSELIGALSYFDEAEKLLKRRLALYEKTTVE